jgi:predicted nucleotidyltransferase
MGKELKDIKEFFKNHKKELIERFGIREVGIFGSYVKGEKREDSDLDILVDFEDGYKSFDNYMDFKFYLEDLLGIKVDLVIKTALKPNLKPGILEETLYV